MTRGIKALVIILIVLVGVLASGTGFFYAKSVSLENKAKTDTASPTLTDASYKASDTTTTPGSTTTPTTSTSTITAPAAIGNRPSAPTDTYTVATGDTMSVIGGKLDISWITLADANGLTTDDANKIKIGQVLIVPKNNQISYTVNSAKAQEIQTSVDGGKDAFRLSAVDSAKSDSPSAYGLAVTDTFTQKTVDATAGTATVTGVHEGKTYEIALTQPATKGAKGIWAIVSIKLAK